MGRGAVLHVHTRDVPVSCRLVGHGHEPLAAHLRLLERRRGRAAARIATQWLVCPGFRPRGGRARLLSLEASERDVRAAARTAQRAIRAGVRVAPVIRRRPRRKYRVRVRPSVVDMTREMRFLGFTRYTTSAYTIPRRWALGFIKELWT